jgi:hypothetical protein
MLSHKDFEYYKNKLLDNKKLSKGKLYLIGEPPFCVCFKFGSKNICIELFRIRPTNILDIIQKDNIYDVEVYFENNRSENEEMNIKLFIIKPINMTFIIK